MNLCIPYGKFKELQESALTYSPITVEWGAHSSFLHTYSVQQDSHCPYVAVRFELDYNLTKLRTWFLCHIHISMLSVLGSQSWRTQTCDVITTATGSATWQLWALQGFTEAEVLYIPGPAKCASSLAPMLPTPSPGWPFTSLASSKIDLLSQCHQQGRVWCQPTAWCLSSPFPFLFAAFSGPDPSCHSLMGGPPSSEP